MQLGEQSSIWFNSVLRGDVQQSRGRLKCPLPDEERERLPEGYVGYAKEGARRTSTKSFLTSPPRLTARRPA